MVEGGTVASMYIQDALASLVRTANPATNNNAATASATVPTTSRDSTSTGSFANALQQEFDKPPYSSLAQSTDPADYPNVTEEEAAEIQEVSQQLESLMLYQLLKQMWSTIPESTLFPTNSGDEMYREMWLEQLAGNAVKQGSVLGIGDMVQRQLLDRANRTVELTDLAPELAELQNELHSDAARETNPYGYMSGLTPGF